MAKYKIEIAQSAEKALYRLPKDTLKRILKKILELAENPFPAGVRKLSGMEHTFRVRIGSHRVIYDVYEKIITIIILKIGHRKDVYR